MKVSIFAAFFFFALLVSGHGQNAPNAEKPQNKIDGVKTAADIERLLDSIDKKYFEAFQVKDALKFQEPECRKLVDDLQIKPWTKADFDNNGYTDLLFIGNNYRHSVIVLMSEGGNKFIVRTLTKKIFQECAFPLVESRGGEKIIKYYSEREANKTLIYKYGDFVELNESPKKYKIEKIEYETSGCFGACPIFKLAVSSADRAASYEAIRFNPEEGKFKGTIRQADFEELANLLNYIDFPNLKDNYSVGWTDDQTGISTVTYDGGKVKKIVDYGKLGTFGLSRAHEILFNLRGSAKWKN